MKISYFFTMSILLFVLTSCAQQAGEEIQQDLYISAASSLTAPLDIIKGMYEQQNPEIELVINYGGSGTLVNQVNQGAPVDLLILASEDWMETAIEQEIVNADEVTHLFTNQLVLAARMDSKLNELDEIGEAGVEKIAIGTPDSVPAGEYTKQALTALGEWENLKRKIVMTKSARQVATYIESGNVDAGFVFQSDLQAFSNLQAVEVIPESLHEPIVYPAVAIDRNGRIEASEAFLAFLTTPEAQEVFQEYGFKEIK